MCILLLTKKAHAAHCKSIKCRIMLPARRPARYGAVRKLRKHIFAYFWTSKYSALFI